MDPFMRSAVYSDVPETVQAKLWALLNADAVLYAMQVVSDLGMPAVLGAEKRLLESGLIERLGNAGSDKGGNDRRKQCVGAMVRQIMEKNGYPILSEKPARTRKSSMFTAGARYQAN